MMAEEIVVTDEMVEAGQRILAPHVITINKVFIREIYRAMRMLEPMVRPGEVDWKKLERWQLEILAVGGSLKDADVRPDQIKGSSVPGREACAGC